MSKIAMYKSRTSKDLIEISFDDFFNGIKTGEWKDLILPCREAETNEEYNELKSKLPVVTPSGLQIGADSKAFDPEKFDHSGLLVLDIDENITDIEETRAELSADPYCRALFLSVSGKGFAFLAQIPADCVSHQEYYEVMCEYIENNYGYGGIKRQGNPNRLRYISYDPDAYKNDFSKPVYQVTSKKDAIRNIIQIREKQEPYGIEGRNNWVFNTAQFMNRASIDIQEAEDFLCSAYSEKDFNEAEIRQTVMSAYRSSETGTFTFPGLQKPKTVIGAKPFYHIKYNAKGEKAGLVIDRHDYLKWLETTFNLGWVQQSNDSEPMLVTMEDNILDHIVSPYHWLSRRVADHINEWETLPGFTEYEPSDLVQVLLSSATNYFQILLPALRKIDYKPLRSQEKVALFPYENGIVAVTDKEKQLVPYSKSPVHIWREQIQKREFIPLKSSEFEDFSFYKFMNNIMGNKLGGDMDKFTSLCSLMGYMIHPYRDPARPVVVVCYDGVVSDKPEGGTGKGILANAVKAMKPTVFLDGKSWDPTNQFAWQRLQPWTQAVCVNDATAKFNFESLHSVLADGIEVNKKNKGAYFIDFEDSPKFLISTNNVLDAEGATNERRIRDIELEPYYSATFSPLIEFNETFFHSWNDEQWNQFDNLMMWCVYLYINHGFVNNQKRAKHKRLFLQKYGYDVMEFLQIQANKGVEEVGKQDFYGMYADAMRSNDIPKLGSRNFYKALDAISEATNGEIVYLESVKENAKYCYLSRSQESETPKIRSLDPKIVTDNPEIDFVD